MPIHALQELVSIARERSPFYRELYSRLPAGGAELRLEDLPIPDQNAFWLANSLKDNRLLTGPLEEGVVFKSGGTTGSPKFSVFTREEWEAFTDAFAAGMERGGMRAGERVANLFYAGELYASFLFIHKALEKVTLPSVSLPIAGSTPPSSIAKLIEDFQITTLAGVPTTLLALNDYLVRENKKLPSVRRAIFGGEGMYPDQRHALERGFPGIRIDSIGYGSVDAGLLGYADPGCGPNEHRVFGRETIVEIVDEDTGEPIHGMDRPGKILVTNLTRALMPIIRYPAGDRAVWKESAGGVDRKFLLLGRGEEAARVGPATLYYEDLRGLMEGFQPGLRMGGFQLIILREEGKDRLVVRVGVESPESIERAARSGVESALYRARPLLEDLARDRMIHPVRWEWIHVGQLQVNPRTGKLRRVLDLRSPR